MSTEFFNDQWRIPSNENQNKVSNYSMKWDPATVMKIDLGTSIDLAGKYFTIAGWYNVPNSTSSRSFFSQGSSKNIGIFTINGILYFFFKTGAWAGITTDTTLATNVWQHIACVYDGTNQIIYINGVAVKTGARTGSVTYDNTPTFLGVLNASSFPFEGFMDQVCIFDYALSSAQVTTLYDGTAVTNPMALSPVPVAYYQLGDQSVSTGATEDYLVPNNSLQDYVFQTATEQHFNIPSLTISEAATISIWVNITVFTGSNTQTLFGDDTSNRIYANKEGTIVRFIYIDENGFGILSTTLLASDFQNKWHHIALVQNGGVATLYIDNVSQGVFSGALRTPNFTSIGATNTGSLAIIGFVSNAALFSTNLPATGTESIASLYNNGNPALDISSYSGLQRWYKLNAQDTFGGTNWTIKDYAGSNDGTSDGMTLANLIQSDLQHTSGYSPYALTLISTNAQQLLLNNGGNAILNGATSFTVSAWINPTDNNLFQNIFSNWGSNIIFRFSASTDKLECFISGGGTTQFAQSGPIMKYGIWQHVAATYNGSLLKIFINGGEVQSVAATGTIGSTNTQDRIGNRPGQTQYFNGGISNVAIWKNSVIDVNTLYNQGVPADLKKLNPSVWWQMGSNSSFDASTDKWTCLNEGTLGTDLEPLNATAQLGNMTNDQITNGPGYSANGLGTSSIDIIGDAPYSSGNGLSESMDVLDRVKDVPS
jgi:hypothetical protein